MALGCCCCDREEDVDAEGFNGVVAPGIAPVGLRGTILGGIVTSQAIEPDPTSTYVPFGISSTLVRTKWQLAQDQRCAAA